jgi:hypothetical protein
MNNIQKLENWKERVLKFNKETYDKVNKELCSGFYTVDGKMNNEAKILIIGYNPGKSGNNITYECFETFENDGNPMSYLELGQGYRYHLAEKTTNVFSKANLKTEQIISIYENNCTKLNLYHLISKDGKGLEDSFDSLNNWHFYRDEMHKFMFEIVDIIKPKLVLIEGKSTWKKLIIDGYETYNRSWNDRFHFGYHFHGKTEFVGYNRNQNTDECANIISEIFQEKMIEI